jgi:hypothetical protein
VPQTVSSGSLQVVAHEPAEQSIPVGQALPQLPQVWLSV